MRNKAGGMSQNGMKNKRLFLKLTFKTCLFVRAKQERTILFPHMHVFQRRKKVILEVFISISGKFTCIGLCVWEELP